MKELDPWNKLNFSQETINYIFSKIDYPGNDQNCWIWTGNFGEKGYGQIHLANYNIC